MKKSWKLLCFYCMTGLIVTGGCATPSPVKSGQDETPDIAEVTDSRQDCSSASEPSAENLSAPSDTAADTDAAGAVSVKKAETDPDGFRSVKERTVVYGPLGAVLHFTEWLLVKLYIIHEK